MNLIVIKVDNSAITERTATELDLLASTEHSPALNYGPLLVWLDILHLLKHLLHLLLLVKHVVGLAMILYHVQSAETAQLFSELFPVVFFLKPAKNHDSVAILLGLWSKIGSEQ